MIPHSLSGLSCVERFYTYSELASTNTVAREMKKRPIKGFFVVQADRQSTGRGQGDATFFSDNSNGLWASIVTAVQPDCTAIVYNHALAMAIHTALSSIASGKKISIKWPNDIFCNDLKIGGILIENHRVFSDLIVLGFGLNINSTPEEFPKSLQSKATSLFIETGTRQSLSILLRSILNLYHLNTCTDRNEILRSFSDNLYKKGALVEICGVCGIFDGIDDNGCFCLLKDDKRILFNTGSPVFL